LLAVFCNANEALSQTIVSGRRPTGADNPQLAQLLNRAVCGAVTSRRSNEISRQLSMPGAFRLALGRKIAHIVPKEHRDTMTRFAKTQYAWGVAVTAGVVLAACATGGVRIGDVYHVAPYNQNLVQYTAAPGEVAVDIHGEAFIDQLPQDAEEIARRLRLPTWVPAARFTTRPSEVARGRQRFVLAFNATARGPIGYGLCLDPGAIEYAAPGNRAKLAAAFCSGDRLAVNPVAETGSLSGPDDPLLTALTPQLMANLLPLPAYQPNPACSDGSC
jgi:hypothetical protein